MFRVGMQADFVDSNFSGRTLDDEIYTDVIKCRIYCCGNFVRHYNGKLDMLYNDV